MKTSFPAFLLRGLRFSLMTGGLVFFVLLGIRFAAAPDSGDPPPPPFDTQPLIRGDLHLTLSATGALSALGTVEVGTQVSGTISEVLVDYNDAVRKGQILAILDTALLDADLKEARASEIRAAASLRQADAELSRHRSLYEKGYLSQQEYLSLTTEREKAQADLFSAQAKRVRAETNRSHAVIRSPIDGKVIERSVEAGQTVAASMNTPTLFILAENLRQMQILAKVDETDIGQIRVGQPIRFTVEAWPDMHFSASVTRIRLNPETISNVVTYTVEAEAANPESRLLPGMTATLDFEISRAEKALIAPEAALRFTPEGRDRPDTPGVWKMEGGKPRFVPVVPRLSDGLSVALGATQELEEGDVLATAMKKDREPQASRPLLSRLFGPPRRGPRN